ncbi:MULTISPECIES: hypothetical protein [Mesorhizobium]|uniref:hypothetical protein n=1 Tax=Mesorhizobium TaxID=68287 RepID=UPI001CD0979B|nr:MULTISPECIES: hypothetical protein [unclassified Mesorhizobium]MCA0024657.1 hypothetical protein [Mesorhizobium sp. B263B1A]MCA0040853.1 hypothetical protein [Mesorhizobium sp. B292B1B]MCA0055672.1 hypothetical protein [Mesorhizobium sp. B261B1A]
MSTAPVLAATDDIKATANHVAGEFDRAVAEIGGSHDAFTSYDYTAYHPGARRSDQPAKR